MCYSGKKIALFGVVLGLIVAAGGCRARAPYPPRPHVRMPAEARYVPPQVQVRVRHHYRYFPETEIYFDITRNLYFYRDERVWRTAPVLPRHIRIDANNFVTTELDDPQPFKYHRDMVKRYPPGLRKEPDKPQEKVLGKSGADGARGEGKKGRPALQLQLQKEQPERREEHLERRENKLEQREEKRAEPKERRQKLTKEQLENLKKEREKAQETPAPASEKQKDQKKKGPGKVKDPKVEDEERDRRDDWKSVWP